MSDKPKLLYAIDNSFYILGDFDTAVSENIVPFLAKEIDKQKAQKSGSIKFFINSSGGHAYELRALLYFVELAKKEGVTVETHVLGKAYSCGSLLAVSGSKGHRYISPLASHLVHWGSASTGWASTETDFKRTAEYLEMFMRQMKKHYLHNTNLTEKQIDKLYDQDSAFLFAHECIKYGLSDKLSAEIDYGSPSLDIL